jgi:hypothetical protein
LVLRGVLGDRQVFGARLSHHNVRHVVVQNLGVSRRDRLKRTSSYLFCLKVYRSVFKQYLWFLAFKI